MPKYRFEQRGDDFVIKGSKISEGGEGAIYRYGPEYLIKIFFDPTAEKERKVRHLLADWKSLVPAKMNPPIWAFPREIVLDSQTGKFVGYKMDRVTNSFPVSYLYNPEKIVERKLQFNLKALAIVMRNMWGAVHISHSLGIMLADITPANFMFSREGRVFVIDTDSMQIQSGRNFFESGIGTLGYLAPEIARGRDLTVKRYSYHDVFSAACVSYQVMTGGWHFTDGKVTSSNGGHLPSMPERTQLCLWPHSSTTTKSGYSITAPDTMVDFSMFSPELQKLFRWTFDIADPEKRPTPKMWRDAFTRFATRLKDCDAGIHQMYHSSRTCPWCELEKRVA